MNLIFRKNVTSPNLRSHRIPNSKLSFWFIVIYRQDYLLVYRNFGVLHGIHYVKSLRFALFVNLFWLLVAFCVCRRNRRRRQHRRRRRHKRQQVNVNMPHTHATRCPARLQDSKTPIHQDPRRAQENACLTFVIDQSRMPHTYEGRAYFLVLMRVDGKNL